MGNQRIILSSKLLLKVSYQWLLGDLQGDFIFYK